MNMTDLSPFFDSLRQKVLVSEVVRSHVKLVRKGREYTGCCPFHKEKSPSFTVNDEKGFYHCFGCGAHGDIFRFLMQRQNISFMEAVEIIASLAGMDVPKRQISPKIQEHGAENKILLEVLEIACQWFEHQLKLTTAEQARIYLERRGLTQETIQKFRLGYAPAFGLKDFLVKRGFSTEILGAAGLIIVPDSAKAPYDRFRERLMFPILDAKGQVIAFGGRVLASGEPKYLNSPETSVFHKGKTLYGIQMAAPSARSGSPLIVVEGYMDVISLHQAGYLAAVAPLGTALTGEQLNLLWRWQSDPILCFDGDAAGIRAAQRAAEKSLAFLKPGCTLQFCFLPAGEDPDSMMRSGRQNDFKSLLQSPKSLADVLWRLFLHNRDVSTPEKKAAARRDLINFTGEIANPDIQHFYRQDFQERLNLIFSQSKSQKAVKGPDHRQEKPILTSRAGQNKVDLGQKILLAILINHPTLISRVIEQLADMQIQSTELSVLRQELLTFASEVETISTETLIDFLKIRGFSQLLNDLLGPKTYIHARFAQPTSSEEEALTGWEEIWMTIESQRHLQKEAQQVVQNVQNDVDIETWMRLKQLKTTNLL